MKPDTEWARKSSNSFWEKDTWLGHKTNEQGIEPIKEKIRAIIKLKPPTSREKLKPFLGATQIFAKFRSKISEKDWPNKTTADEENVKELGRKRKGRVLWNEENENRNTISSTLCQRPSKIVTTDASRIALRVTSWQKKRLKAFASWSWNDAE